MSKSIKKRLADLKYQEETGALNSKINDTEQLLREENKTRIRLKVETSSKIREITATDDAIATEERQHRHKKQLYIEETKRTEEEKRRRLIHLCETENQLKKDIAPIDLLERENSLLQNQLNQLLEEYKNESKVREELKEDRKQQNFDVRMLMDESLRKRIHELNKDYETSAITKLEQNAEKSKLENQLLDSEIKSLEEKSRHLIQEQQFSYDQLRRLRIEQEVISVTAEIQEQKVSQLEELTSKQNKQIEELTTFIDHIKLQIKELKDSYTQKSIKTDTLHKLEHQLQKLTKQRQKSEADVIHETQELVSFALDLSELERQERSLRIISGLTREMNWLKNRDMIMKSLRFQPQSSRAFSRGLSSKSSQSSSSSSSLHHHPTAAAALDGESIALPYKSSKSLRTLEALNDKNDGLNNTSNPSTGKDQKEEERINYERIWKSTYK